MNRISAGFLLVVLTACTTAQAQTDINFGVRGSFHFDNEDFGLGGEVLFPVVPNLNFNPNAQYIFIDNGDAVSLNADFQYDLAATARTLYWAGAGLGYRRYDPDGPVDADDDVGVNLMLGVGIVNPTVWPYAQALVFAGDNSEFVLEAGLRFF